MEGQDPSLTVPWLPHHAVPCACQQSLMNINMLIHHIHVNEKTMDPSVDYSADKALTLIPSNSDKLSIMAVMNWEPNPLVHEPSERPLHSCSTRVWLGSEAKKSLLLTKKKKAVFRIVWHPNPIPTRSHLGLREMFGNQICLSGGEYCEHCLCLSLN